MNELVELLQKRLVILPVWGWLVLGAHQLWRRMAALPKPAPVTRMEWGPKPLEYPVRYAQRWKIAGTGSDTIVRFLGELLGLTREEVETVIKELVGEGAKHVAVLADKLSFRTFETSQTLPNGLTANWEPAAGFSKYRITPGANSEVAGIKAPGANERDIIEVRNVGGGAVNLTFLNESASAEAANRIRTNSLENLRLGGGTGAPTGAESAMFLYDHISERWTPLGIGQISGKQVKGQTIPAEPAEGAVTSGEPGLTRIRSFRLQGNGVLTEFTLTHSIGTRQVIVSAGQLEVGNVITYETPAEAGFKAKVLNLNTVIAVFAVAPAKGTVISVTVTG